MLFASSAGSLDPQGPVARQMADLWWLMLWIGLAVFVVFAGFLAVGALRRPAPEPQDATPRTGRWFVLGGVLGPLAVLVVVLVATVQAMRVIPTDAPEDALVIEVVGHQWWWEIHYPDEGVTTANELHLPVGRAVALRLTSADVIHSFWVPRLGGKIDLLPDGVNTLVLEASEPGEHRSQCAEFCGLQHTNMGLIVVAEPPEDFDSWIAGQQEPAAEPTESTAVQGQEVFFAADCVDCHTIRGTPADGTDGPDLTHVGSRPTLAAATLPNTPEAMADWVTDPHTVKSGVEMPVNDHLDADELDALVSYLQGLE